MPSELSTDNNQNPQLLYSNLMSLFNVDTLANTTTTSNHKSSSTTKSIGNTSVAEKDPLQHYLSLLSLIKLPTTNTSNSTISTNSNTANAPNVNKVNTKGIFPLFTALKQKNEQLVQLLIKNGANIELTTNTGKPLIEYSEDQGLAQKIFEFIEQSSEMTEFTDNEIAVEQVKFCEESNDKVPET